MNEPKEFYLKEDFSFGPSFKTSCTVSLTSDAITYESISAEISEKIELEDVIGASVTQPDGGINNVESAYIRIYSYPFNKGGLFSTARRQRLEYVFAVSDRNSSAENLEVAEKWVRCIRWLLKTKPDLNLLLKQADNPPRQRFLIFINPFGGKGTAKAMFEKDVQPMLEEADVQYELRETEYMGHAREIIQNLEGLKEFDCIVCCSGDGIINEVINGFMSRADWQESIKIPVAHIPCGSGNGLCASSIYHSGEPFDMISSVFTVLKGEEWPLDIMKTETPEPHYSFLAIVFGIVADVDIESELFRYLGDLRFSIMAVKKIIQRNTFSCKLWYLPVDGSVDGSNVCNSRVGENVQLSDGTSKCQGEDGQNLEDGKFEDGNLKDGNLKDGNLKDGNLKDGNLSNGILNDANLDKSKSSCDSKDEKLGDHLKDGKLGDMDDANSAHGLTSDGILGNDSLATCIPSKFLPNFEEPIPESWNLIEADFVGLLFISTTHIGKGTFCVPDGCFGDGIIHCMSLNGDISRTNLLNVLTKLDAGEHLSVPGVSMLKARAFRIEPQSASSEIITIDGERFKWGKIQAEIYKGLGRVRCRGPPASSDKMCQE